MVVVHPDGTIFTTVGNQAGAGAPILLSAIGIDPTTGTQKFSVPIPTVSWLGNIMIAGDGYAYVSYATCNAPCSNYGPANKSLMLLQIGSNGTYNNVDVYDWTDAPDPWDNAANQNCACEFHMITNADTGTLVTWLINGIPGMAITTGTSVSLASPPQVPRQFDSLVPILQAQDGSFVGSVPVGDDDGSQYNMVSFDASGNVRWVVPNDQPQIATADGGVIGQSGITYDSNGNATGQVSSLPTQSWRGNFYIEGSVDQLFWDLYVRATTWWAQRNSNPSSTSTAARPWSFTISWQNQFDFIPDFPINLPNLKTDMTSASAKITQAALKALKAAYDQWPVNIAESIPGIGDHRAVVQTSIAGPACGNTDLNFPNTSTIPYECNMEQAQIALQISIPNAQAEAAAMGNLSLIQAIGRGIGNNAAHEIAHQFLGECCSMDVLTSADPNAATTYNNGDGSGDPSPTNTDSDPSPYTGYGKNGTTAIHWENTTQRALQACLSKGYQNFHGLTCAARLNLVEDQRGVASPHRAWAKALAPGETKSETFEKSILPSVMLLLEAAWSWF
jgi:hypothetical protein